MLSIFVRNFRELRVCAVMCVVNVPARASHHTFVPYSLVHIAFGVEGLDSDAFGRIPCQ